MADLREELQASLGDEYNLEEEIRGGGMSRVFLAQELSLKRPVVLKVLPPEMAAEVSADRFRREVQLAAQLQHPHIVPLLTASETDQLLYFTMPYVKGETLREHLRKEGELPVAETVRIMREIALALAYAHDKGVVHRDIKPENILISGGCTVVTDFGIAKAVAASGGFGGPLTSHGIALGTPAYMAPEQVAADTHIDHRADIYALGVVAYEMLAGATPFAGRSAHALAAAQVTEAPEHISRRRSSVPPALAALVMSCLEKRPADRPQSAHEILRQLDALTTPNGGIQSMAVPASISRPRWQIIAGIGVLLVLLSITALTVNRMRRSNSAGGTASETPFMLVIPFRNVGRAEGREFADGMTEEITSRLSSLSGLKVVGRQTADSYAGTTKSPQKISEEIGVNYLLTGTVRWDRTSDGKEIVRVSPALIRTADATQVWAQAFETVLSGIFEVQSKIASEVSTALNIVLRDPERKNFAQKPTSNIEAYSYYLRGTELVRGAINAGPLGEAIDALEKAVALDPDFAVAYARLSSAHIAMYWFGRDPSKARREKAEAALKKALSLNPSLPEAHLALGLFHYHIDLDFSKALQEFALVEQTMPNNAEAFFFKGAIQRRQGNWDESVTNMERAAEIEPRQASYLVDLGNTLINLREFDKVDRVADRIMIVTEKADDAYEAALQFKAEVAIARDGDLAKAVKLKRQAFDAQPNRDRARLAALYSGWPGTAEPEIRRQVMDLKWKPEFGEKRRFMTNKMMVHYAWKDLPGARAYADSALAALNPEDLTGSNAANNIGWASRAHAILGHREEALREVERSVKLRPVSSDAYTGPVMLLGRALTLMILGDRDAAITQLEQLLSMPSRVSRNVLRLHPLFDQLRSNLRFQQLIR